MRHLSSARWRRAVRRCFAAVVGLAASLALAAQAATACDALSPDRDLLERGHGCVKAKDARFEHTFDVDLAEREAVATIRLSGAKRLCAGETQKVSLVSYLAPAKTFQVPQYGFDDDTAEIDSETTSAELTVEVPNCFTQVDFVFGGIIDPLVDNGDRYGDRKIGADGTRSWPVPGSGSPRHAWFNGGEGRCQTAPAAETVSLCDGTLALSLRNGEDATTTEYAILGADGSERHVTVEREQPVQEITIPAKSAKSVVVRSDGVTVGTYAWERPGNCDAATVSGSGGCSASTIEIANPSANTEAAEASILVAGEDGTRTVTVAPGATERVDLDKVDVTASVTVLGETTLVDLRRPATCAGASLAGGTSPGTAVSAAGATRLLAVTGTSVGLIAGVALVLVGVGVALFVIARRRRIRFTA